MTRIITTKSGQFVIEHYKGDDTPKAQALCSHPLDFRFICWDDGSSMCQICGLWNPDEKSRKASAKKEVK